MLSRLNPSLALQTPLLQGFTGYSLRDMAPAVRAIAAVALQVGSPAAEDGATHARPASHALVQAYSSGRTNRDVYAKVHSWLEKQQAAKAPAASKFENLKGGFDPLAHKPWAASLSNPLSAHTPTGGEPGEPLPRGLRAIVPAPVCVADLVSAGIVNISAVVEGFKPELSWEKDEST